LRLRRKKPGFPLQVLGFAYANPVGFPLQSLARPTGFPRSRATYFEKNHHEVEEIKKRRKNYALYRNFFDFFDLAVKILHFLSA
jgi:hypothetical protein